MLALQDSDRRTTFLNLCIMSDYLLIPVEELLNLSFTLLLSLGFSLLTALEVLELVSDLAVVMARCIKRATLRRRVHDDVPTT